MISAPASGRSVLLLPRIKIWTRDRKTLEAKEAKRVLDPPTLTKPLAEGTHSSSVATLARGLRGEKLKGEWFDWLNTLADYVGSIASGSGTTPQRVILTDGDTVYVFRDPADSFLPGGHRLEDNILLFELSSLTASTAARLFAALEYNEVARHIPLLSPNQLPFFIDPKISPSIYVLR